MVWLEEDAGHAGDSPDNRHEIAVAVKDTGPHIAKKGQGRLFKNFSQVNRGSTFYFTLPLNVPKESKAKRPAAGKVEVMAEDDYKKAATSMHGFKDELGNLCMDEAYHLAKELDAMLKSNNLDRFKKSVAKYEHNFSQQ